MYQVEVLVPFLGVLKIWDVGNGPHGKVIKTFNASKIWLTSVDVE